MHYKKIIVLTVLLSLFTISCVSAADNATGDVISAEIDASLEMSVDAIPGEDGENLTADDNSISAEKNNADEDILGVGENTECLAQSSLPEVLSISSSDDEILASSYHSFHAKTFKVGKYRATFSASQIKSVMNAQDNGKWKEVVKNTGKYKIVKKNKYKTKTKTKTVCFGRGKYTYGFWLQEYINKGWKLVKTWQKGRYYDSQFGTMYKKCYAKFKKTVKVKSGTKKVKYPVKMSLVSYYLDGYYPGDNHAALYLWYSQGILSERSVYVY